MASKVTLNPASHTPQTGFLVLLYLQAGSVAPQNGGALPVFPAVRLEPGAHRESQASFNQRCGSNTSPQVCLSWCTQGSSLTVLLVSPIEAAAWRCF